MKNIILIILFLLSHAPLFAFDQKVERAALLISQGQHDQAVNVLKKILKEDANHQEANLLYARVLYSRANYKKAFLYYNKLEKHAIRDEVAFEYAVVLFSERRYNESIKYFSRVRELSALKPYADFYSAVCFLNAANFPQALIHFERITTGLDEKFERLRLEYLNSALNVRENIFQINNELLNPPLPGSHIWRPFDNDLNELRQKALKEKEDVKLGFTYNITPSANFYLMHASANSGKFREHKDKYLNYTQSLNIYNQYSVDAEGNNKTYIGLNLNAQRVFEKFKSESYQKNVAGVYRPSNSASISSVSQGFYHKSVYDVSPMINWAITDKSELNYAYNYGETHPLFEREDKDFYKKSALTFSSSFPETTLRTHVFEDNKYNSNHARLLETRALMQSLLKVVSKQNNLSLNLNIFQNRFFNDFYDPSIPLKTLQLKSRLDRKLGTINLGYYVGFDTNLPQKNDHYLHQVALKKYNIGTQTKIAVNQFLTYEFILDISKSLDYAVKYVNVTRIDAQNEIESQEILSQYAGQTFNGIIDMNQYKLQNKLTFSVWAWLQISSNLNYFYNTYKIKKIDGIQQSDIVEPSLRDKIKTDGFNLDLSMLLIHNF